MQNADVTDQSAAVFSVDCDRDVQFLEFVMPSSDTTVTAPFVPAVKIRSNGIQSGAFQVQLEMIWRGSGDIVYSRIMTVPFLDMNKEALINFPEVKALPPGQILMMGRVLQSPPDRNPANDTLGRTFNHNGGISPPTGIRAQGVPDAVLLWWGASLTADITCYGCCNRWYVYLELCGRQCEERYHIYLLCNCHQKHREFGEYTWS
jgi:hypothetical protein